MIRDCGNGVGEGRKWCALEYNRLKLAGYRGSQLSVKRRKLTQVNCIFYKTNLCQIPETNDQGSSCVCNPFTVFHLTNGQCIRSSRAHFKMDTTLVCKDLWWRRLVEMMVMMVMVWVVGVRMVFTN